MKREDVMLLIASFIIAVGLWYQVQPMFEPGREREFIVPLKLENKPDELAVFPASDNVTLVASGTLADLDKLDASKIVAFLDLSNSKPGDIKVPIQVRGPADNNLMLRPKMTTMRVTCEFILRVDRAVKIITTGTPPEGLVLASTVASPANVELYGPSSYVKLVNSLQATIDLSKLKPGQSITVPVAPLDANGDPVPSIFTNPAQVTVAASFTASIATREVSVIVDYIGKAAPNYEIQEITVEPGRVEISGKSEDVSSTTTIDTAQLNVDGLSESKTFRIKLVAPEGISLKTQEVVVNVKVKRR